MLQMSGSIALVPDLKIAYQHRNRQQSKSYTVFNDLEKKVKSSSNKEDDFELV